MHLEWSIILLIILIIIGFLLFTVWKQNAKQALDEAVLRSSKKIEGESQTKLSEKEEEIITHVTLEDDQKNLSPDELKKIIVEKFVASGLAQSVAKRVIEQIILRKAYRSLLSEEVVNQMLHEIKGETGKKSQEGE